jgi:hypothetical protein
MACWQQILIKKWPEIRSFHVLKDFPFIFFPKSLSSLVGSTLRRYVNVLVLRGIKTSAGLDRITQQSPRREPFFLPAEHGTEGFFNYLIFRNNLLSLPCH